MTEHLNALPDATLLHEFELLGVLGSGGFGITYLGQDRYLEKKVAIKEYMPMDIAIRQQGITVRAKTTLQEDTENFDWGLKAFLQEARILAQFQHPNIIQIHRFFEANGTAYIVMDYVEGETLHTRLEHQGKLSETELTDMLLPLIEGLKKVHEAGILHRDIKPANIIIRTDGSPLLIDFGAARQKINNRTKSQPITALITPGYAPMEQYHSSGHLGAWSDIYALSAVSYHCLSGSPPPEAPARIKRDPYKLAHKYLKTQASDKLLKAVDWGMSVDEEKRPQSLQEWEAAFSSKSSAVKMPYPLIASIAGGLMVVSGLVYTGYYLYQQDQKNPDPVLAEGDSQTQPDDNNTIPQPIIGDNQTSPIDNSTEEVLNERNTNAQGCNMSRE
ncbi:MAG: protein kinase [Methylococcaceae bacterium]|nr:protein kinase [Methylococcaceae bacterium]